MSLTFVFCLILISYDIIPLGTSIAKTISGREKTQAVTAKPIIPHFSEILDQLWKKKILFLNDIHQLHQLL